jgi:hypothetical protein
MGIEDREHRYFADFDDEVRGSDVAHLHELGAGPISERSLSEWAGDSASRHSLLGEVTWCSIRWSKALGQPRTATFAAAFAVSHEYWAVEKVDVGGGVLLDKSRWENAVNGPLLFPGAEDGDDYVIPILIYPVFFWVNRLSVRFAKATWDSSSVEITAHGYKVVTPAEQSFQYLRDWGPPVVLDEFRVVRRPYRLIG